MIVYNVTVKINTEVHDDWLAWMKDVHIPDVMNTGCFLESKIFRVLLTDEVDGITYSIQYSCESMKVLQQYQGSHAPRLQKEHTERYEGKFVAFRTLLEEA